MKYIESIESKQSEENLCRPVCNAKNTNLSEFISLQADQKAIATDYLQLCQPEINGYAFPIVIEV